uniref:Microtubule associated tumor suppressor 1b n=1 Tax=Cynoglossus semilaevis TaxID=244447 RepID=A0A3P8VSI7_CYNSE
MLWSPRLSLSNFHVKLTAKGLFRNLQLLSGCRKNTVVFHAVDKNKPREAPPRPTNANSSSSSSSLNREQAEKKNQAIGQLRRLLVQGNRKVEALATVIQHLFSEREESLKQRKELSVELQKLQEQLVASKQSCEHLQKEREEARVNLEESLRRQEEEHREALVQLEDRLKSFYQTEWDKVHQTYQEEADKCRLLMEQQVRHVTVIVRSSLCLSVCSPLTELFLSWEQERICELSAEKEALGERLQEEEERRRRILTDKNLDSHTLYLEQELESLKVVLDMKNNQLHQKEKKLMEMEKLVETNVKLEECLKKVQQENEDFKARMDKHAALSKQLSNEQAILQQTLQKESKVNKRLSMENEELLWKLHNGDLLASPRRPSPTSPFSSPRNSASFPTAAPLSPR